MTMPTHPEAYYVLLEQGPFTGTIDPWSEHARYFHQIHGGFIGQLLADMSRPLLRMGYLVSREASLQIAEQRQPDIAIRNDVFRPPERLDYTAIATALNVDPGTVVDWQEPEWDAIYIYGRASGEIVSILEVISPKNKASDSDMTAYQERRDRLLQRGVNIVEIDLTRSVKRLLRGPMAQTVAYHIAIYLPDDKPRLIGMDYGEPLKPFALPLINEGLAVQLQPAYQQAYQTTQIAGQLQQADAYHLDNLPFPTMLTPEERADAMQRVQQWQTQLAKLAQV